MGMQDESENFGKQDECFVDCSVVNIKTTVGGQDECVVLVVSIEK